MSVTAPPNTGRTLFDVGSEISGTIVRQVDPEIQVLHGIKPGLPALFGYGESTLLGENYVFEWPRHELRPHKVALGAAFTAASDTTLTLTDSNLVMDGQLLYAGNQVFRVTGHTNDTVITVTKSYNGSTAANLAEGDYVYIGLNDTLDDEEFPLDVWAQGEMISNTPLQILKKWGGSDLRSALRSYVIEGSNDVDDQTTKKLLEVEKQLEISMIYGRGATPTGSVRGHFKGIRQLITTHVTAVNDVLTPQALFNQIEDMHSIDEDSAGRLFIGDMTIKRIWNAFWKAEFQKTGEPMTSEVGITMDAVHTDWGTFRFMVCRAMPPGELWLVNPDDIKLRPIETTGGTGWMEHEWKEDTLQKRVREVGVSNVLTLQVKEEKRHGRWTDISQNLGLYGGAL